MPLRLGEYFPGLNLLTILSVLLGRRLYNKGLDTIKPHTHRVYGSF